MLTLALAASFIVGDLLALAALRPGVMADRDQRMSASSENPVDPAVLRAREAGYRKGWPLLLAGVVVGVCLLVAAIVTSLMGTDPDLPYLLLIAGSVVSAAGVAGAFVVGGQTTQRLSPATPAED